jgi:hypothetical protein
MEPQAGDVLRERSVTFRSVPDGVVAGTLLLACALIAVLALMHHPAVSTRHAAAAMTQIVRFAAVDRAVHGTMILVSGALLFALSVFSVRRGLGNQTVLAGLVLYALGSVAIIAAALIDGFVIPIVAASYAADTPAALPGAVAALRLCAAAIQVASVFGLGAISVALALWSVNLLATAATPVRVTAAVGLIAAVAPTVVFLTTGMILTAHLLVAIILPEAIWYGAVGVLLVRRLI